MICNPCKEKSLAPRRGQRFFLSALNGGVPKSERTDGCGAGERQKVPPARGWSKKELAAKVGYTTEAMIHQIEEGVKWPSIQQAKALAAAFGVSLSALVGDAAGGGVTNHANGAHAIGYQHNEGAVLMTDELQAMVRQVVREELTVQREQLLHDMRVVLREAAREADGAPPERPRRRGNLCYRNPPGYHQFRARSPAVQGGEGEHVGPQGQQLFLPCIGYN